jgi:hypothetical protein
MLYTVCQDRTNRSKSQRPCPSHDNALRQTTELTLLPPTFTLAPRASPPVSVASFWPISLTAPFPTPSRRPPLSEVSESAFLALTVPVGVKLRAAPALALAEEEAVGRERVEGKFFLSVFLGEERFGTTLVVGVGDRPSPLRIGGSEREFAVADVRAAGFLLVRDIPPGINSSDSSDHGSSSSSSSEIDDGVVAMLLGRTLLRRIPFR